MALVALIYKEVNFLGSINLSRALAVIIILLIAIDIHELAHAVVADRLGDDTPRRLGEVSLNPFVHMDQFGILLLLMTALSGFGFTYGRTHVTPTKMRFGPQRGNALVAIAGPISNLVLAGLISIPLTAGVNQTVQMSHSTLDFLYLAMTLNILLFVLNLIPIPPLDGFTVLAGFLSPRQLYRLAPLQQYGPLVLLVLFIGDPQIHVIGNVINPAISRITTVLCSGCGA